MIECINFTHIYYLYIIVVFRFYMSGDKLLRG